MLAWLPLRWRFETCGLADEPFLMCTVELLEVGEAAREASDSTWSIEWDCHPLLTLTIAYESRVLSSAESCNKGGVSNGDMTKRSNHRLTSPSRLVAVEAILTALVFLV